MNKKPPQILVVGPFMHRQGHFAIFPTDLARAFTANEANVTLIYPFKAAVSQSASNKFQSICLEHEKGKFNRLMTLSWHMLEKHPILLCLAWIIFHVRKGDYDLVYWTDFEPGNQQSTWPLGLAALLGLYRHRTAFTEHHNFNWSRHRWQRMLRLDRIRLRHIEMFVHSKKLLEWIRRNMNWPEKGHYVPWGLWPNQSSDEDRKAARDMLGIPHEARVLLVFGMQAIRRKEIDTLAAAVRHLPLEKPLVILFAGMKVKDEPHPFDEPELTTKTNLRVQHHEAFIPDEMVKAFFSAADAVWAYYGSFIGASGVLAQAVAFGRVPICTRDAESGELCRQYQIGLVTHTDDVAGVQAAIARFMAMSPAEQAAFEAATQEAARAMAWPNITRKIMDTMFAKTMISPAVARPHEG